MNKTKSDHINELVSIAFALEEKFLLQDEDSENLKKMASLARQGKQESHEFKMLQLSSPSFIDFSDEFKALRSVVKKLKSING